MVADQGFGGKTRVRNDMYHIPLFNALDPALSGGKAANLARCASLGFSIPDGFVISREAFRQFLQANEFNNLAQAAVEHLHRAVDLSERAPSSSGRV